MIGTLLPARKYKEFIHYMPICCVDVVVHVGRSFLLVKRIQEPAKNEWWFPGGFLKMSYWQRVLLGRLERKSVWR